MTSIGKQRGLARLADRDGYFTMVALDQRPPLTQAIGKARGVAPEDVAFSDMLAAKRLLVEALSNEASSMLLDPNFAVPAAIDILPARTGMIVTLEEHRFADTPGGRKSRSIDNWSVEKIRRMGGDAVKVLAWYRPDATEDVLQHQKDYVRTIGEDCRRHDIPYVLELLVYPFPDSAQHTTDYVESADKRADLVIESVREFAKPEYGVDLFKLETPLPAASLPPVDGSAESRAAAAQFETVGKICADAGIPWVLLSGGAAPEQFERVLSYSYAAGAQGFLAGRTIWLDAIQNHFPDRQAVFDALNDSGMDILKSLRRLTKAEARPWEPQIDFSHIGREGAFSCAYA
ncbi:MAG TPA: tagatose 1,6-diphosphate aldolase [Paracoccus sp. (in: a-proteobacteria)]|uniref:tagatose 1,6-diphosphate aldolase n=1 Tax=uncultured Paracoccus sp. TaxID=189685 RepID=UPI002617D18F|nr:tagatose 1,6-diphosphate aldolase [uncultured Paracoccus sp.]HMQ41038.1 tagatose 1,6-diphosphate aldolase [Paracoccus sp. (in: a-proteobacteria)]